MTAMNISPCAGSGLKIIRDLAERIWPDAYRNIISTEQIDHMLEMMYSPEVMNDEIKNGVEFDLLYVDGEPAGFASYGPPADSVLKLHKIYLLPELHGHGCGAFLLRHVIARAEAAGCRRIVLNVNKNNRRAIAFYRRNGFGITASVVSQIGKGFVMDDHVMELLINKPK